VSRAPVLVTGGFGAIGSFVVRRLLDDGHPVVVFSRHANYALVPDLVGRVEHVAGDVQDRAALERAVREYGVRRIIHLAAALGGGLEKDPPLGYQVNVLGSLNVFDVVRDLGLERVVFTSSKAVYGSLRGAHAAPGFAPVTEDYVGQTSNVYGATKKAVEDAAHHYRRLFGLDIIALRLGSTYGPGKGRGGGGPLSYPQLKTRMIESALAGESLEVPWADVRDDIVYNRDVAKGAVLAAFAPKSAHWQFNIAGGSLTSVRDFAAEVMRVVPGHRLTVLEAPSDPPGNVTGILSIERAVAELGYRPDFPGAAGVADYVAVMRRTLRAETPA
jgi:UDP-glucose 4-epimerase